MRSLWTIVSFFAVVNLLALLLFAGWLWQSGRLNMKRVSAARELFAPTLADEARAAEEDADAVRRAGGADVVPARLSSREQLNQLTTLQDQEQQVAQRLKEESEMLARQFERLNAQIEAERTAFEAERRGWEEATRAERERKADEQFAQTVRQYESVPPKQGKEMLVELVRGGQREQAVAYLDAMNPRALSKILREFKQPDEIVLATELLERLRTFGLGIVEPESSNDDDVATVPDNPAE